MYAHSVPDLEAELRTLLGTASERLLDDVDVNAGELHRSLDGHPDADHRMPNCRRAMNAEMRGTAEVRSAPPRGAGASLTIRCRLPR